MSDPSSTIAGSSPVTPIPNGISSNLAQAGPSTPPRAQNGDIQMNGETDRGTNGEPSADVSQVFTAKRDEEQARRDRSLAEFLVMLDGYKPVIPEEVTEYYLQRAGFECSDPRLKRLLSLSAQKFISDLSRDAYHFAKLRINGTAVGRGRPAAGVDRNRVVLTMDDLSLALGEHGVNVKKPDYYL
ncbi:MAG: Transcription initiation factor TFIID subunit 10 [Tremellales sp. Tagirdzhanova-0007]|nr:MAG: Transcription initiation factor TFIID subunit 10 [Tremellales sp. Tagirdzhanova-0007]